MPWMDRRGVLVVLGVFLSVAGDVSLAEKRGDLGSIEDAVLAVNARMAEAAENVDADGLFSYMADNDGVSVIQDGLVMGTRQEALERVRGALRGIARIRYVWKRRSVTVLSPEVAILAAEGESIATTVSGEVFTTPFAQTVVFVLRAGRWKALHAHQSSARER